MSIYTRLICSCLIIGSVFAAPRNDSPAPFRPGVVLVGFRPSVTESQKSSVIGVAGANELKRIGVGVHVLKVIPGFEVRVVQFLKSFPEILYAELDYQQRVNGDVPNDMSFGNQWAMLNTGQVLNGYGGVPGDDNKAVPAWSITTGSPSVVVAVLDSGTQYSHPDLFVNMWNNPGGIGGCAAGTHGFNVLTGTCDPMDDETFFGGHGTHVSGLLGAVGNNGAGVTGVAWTTSIMAVKWVSADANGFTSDLITASDWVIAAKQAGVNVRIINDSATFPGTGFSQALSDEIDLLALNDILFVTAAGNSAQDNDSVPRYPCSYARPNMICVAALDMDNSLWVASDWGRTTVQLAAPGANIYSTLRQSNYGYVSGGSMSSPQVAGTAALILSLGYQSVSSLRSMILNNVDVDPLLSAKVSTSGRLNVCKAVPGCSAAVTAAPANWVAPVVTGVARYGSIVGASTGVWTGAPTSYTYQWYRCLGGGCFPIAGAISQTYAILAAADAGAPLSVSVRASNVAGTASAQSPNSAVVAPAQPPFTIGSTIPDGSFLSGSVRWEAMPLSPVNFVQFYIDGVLSQAVSSSPFVYNQGTTSLLDTSTLGSGSHTLGIRALSTDNRTYSFYGATITVANSPINTAPPVISGTPAVGQTLFTSTGSWTGAPTGYSYQWYRCAINGASCSPIPGATASSYLVASLDSGSTIRSSVTAMNASGSGTATSAAVTIGVPSITTASLPGGTQSTNYSASLAASGGTPPYTWSIIAGALPTGLALASGTGVISGTPTVTGTASFTVQVRDANAQTNAKPFSIAISAAGGLIALVQSNAAEGTAVGSISAGFPSNNTGGNLILAFVRMSSTSQSIQVTDTSHNVYTDAISQTQTTDGHQIHLFYAQNIAGGANTVTAAFSAANNHPWMAVYEYRGLSTAAPLDRVSGAQGAGTTPNTGTTGTTTAANELVFAGAGFQNDYAGTIMADPSYAMQQQDAGTSRAANESTLASSSAAYTGTFVLNSSANWSAVIATFRSAGAPIPPSITTNSLPGGTQNSPYNATLAASGGATPYTWSIVSGSLPPGLTLASGTGVISGTPAAAGNSGFTVQLTDANAQTASKALSITIGAATGIALVQSNAVEGSGVGSLSAAFPFGNSAGNLIVAFVRMSTTAQTVHVTDARGNVYTEAVSQTQTTDGHQIHLFYAKNVVGGANTVAATFSGVNNHPWIAVFEYRGLSTTAPLDRVKNAQGSGTAPNTGATASTSTANELVFAGAGFQNDYPGPISAGTSYTVQQQDTGLSRAVNESSIVSSRAPYTGTFGLSLSTNWSAVIATFK